MESNLSQLIKPEHFYLKVMIIIQLLIKGLNRQVKSQNEIINYHSLRLTNIKEDSHR